MRNICRRRNDNLFQSLSVSLRDGLPGAHTQASTLDEIHKNLQDVVQLCLQEMTEDEIKDLPDFVGIQKISVAV